MPKTWHVRLEGGRSMVQVLVVDDDAPTREVLREVLELSGYDVVEAADGSAALDFLRAARTPVVTLLDLDMPRADGLDVLRTCAANPHALGCHRFILLTAVAQSRVQLATDLLTSLSVPVVLKPFDVDDLLSAVARAAQALPATP